MLTLEKATRFGVLKSCRTGLAFVVGLVSLLGHAQDLAPRAYLITPKHSNAYAELRVLQRRPSPRWRAPHRGCHGKSQRVSIQLYPFSQPVGAFREFQCF